MGWFSTDKKGSLEKKYRKLMEEARDIQRSGDIKAYAIKSDEADQVLKELEALKKK